MTINFSIDVPQHKVDELLTVLASVLVQKQFNQEPSTTVDPQAEYKIVKPERNIETRTDQFGRDGI